MCQRLESTPNRFKVTLFTDNILFNRVLCMDLFTIENDRILNIVDKDTKFNAAKLLGSESTVFIWDSYLSM